MLDHMLDSLESIKCDISKIDKELNEKVCSKTNCVDCIFDRYGVCIATDLLSILDDIELDIDFLETEKLR